MANLFSIKSKSFKVHWHNELEYVFLCPCEALTNKKIYGAFCDGLFNILNADREFKKKAQPIFIISSTGKFDGKYETDNFNNKFIFDFAHVTFLLNSNILIRFIDIQKDQTNVKNFITQKVMEGKKLFEQMYSPKYFINNIWEHLALHLRLQTINSLAESYSPDGAHSKYLTPYVYSNELKLREDLCLSHELEIYLKVDTKSKENKKNNGLNFRILLIDDKIGEKGCKAKLIKTLLDLEFDNDKKNDVCWKTSSDDKISSVRIFTECKPICCQECNNLKHIKTKDQKRGDEDCFFIEIHAVKSLSHAREVLGNGALHFDVIMMDYLLDNKKNENGEILDEREFATEFWGDGREQYFDLSDEKLAKKEYTNEDKNKYLSLRNAYSDIKANRGPLQRLWIFPITSFNQTFIDDLRNKGVRLIDYFWYLSRGADPINTPYLFINTLNKFLQLQIESAIFSLEGLKKFLKKSLSKAEPFIKDNTDIAGLKNLFGSEYVFFISKYGNEEQIYRDSKQGSLFANFLEESFFKNNNDLCRLNRLIRKLYYTLAYGEESEKEISVECLYRLYNQLCVLDNLQGIKDNYTSDIQSFHEAINLRFKP